MDTMNQFARDAVFPSWWANALGQFLSVMADNLVLLKADATHVQIPASSENGAAISVKGRWRWIETNLTVAHPGGGAGTYPVFVTAANNDITSSPNPFTDATNYAFNLVVLAPGNTPTIVAGTVDVYRQIGSVVWNGTAISRVIQTVPSVSIHSANHAVGGSDPLTPADIGGVPSGDPTVYQPGDLITTGASSRAGALLCDGSAVSRTTYPQLFAAIGTNYGSGDGSSTFNLPNFLGRVIIGAGSGAGLTARSRGQVGGEENHVLAYYESGSPNLATVADPYGAVTSFDAGGGTLLVTQSGCVLAGLDNGGGQYPVLLYGTGAFWIGLNASVPALTIYATNAQYAHNNVQPFGVAYVFIKT